VEISEISEISENHLKAIVGWRQVAEVTWFGRRTEKVEEKPQGEEKATETGSRDWQSAGASADYIDLRGYEARHGKRKK
jgi:hypothetical protein